MLLVIGIAKAAHRGAGRLGARLPGDQLAAEFPALRSSSAPLTGGQGAAGTGRPVGDPPSEEREGGSGAFSGLPWPGSSPHSYRGEASRWATGLHDVRASWVK